MDLLAFQLNDGGVVFYLVQHAEERVLKMAYQQQNMGKSYLVTPVTLFLYLWNLYPYCKPSWPTPIPPLPLKIWMPSQLLVTWCSKLHMYWFQLKAFIMIVFENLLIMIHFTKILLFLYNPVEWFYLKKKKNWRIFSTCLINCEIWKYNFLFFERESIILFVQSWLLCVGFGREFFFFFLF